MFESLDDDLEFRPDAAFRAGVRRRGRALRRRRRSLATGAVLAPEAVLGAGALWAKEKVDAIDRVDIAVGGPADDAVGDQPVDVLVVGTDVAMPGQGRPEGAAPRADSMLLVRLDPVAGQVRAVSVPRDLWLEPQPGEPVGTEAERASAVRARGPDALVQRLEAGLAVDGVGPGIDHYVELDGDGFRRLVDLAGGVAVTAATPLRDRSSGVDLPAGCSPLDGDQALALARARHLEAQDPDGTWAMDPGGDLGRTVRGAELATGIGEALLAVEPTPASVASVLDVLADSATIDAELSVTELVEWARWVRSLPDDAIEIRPLALVPVTVDGQNVVAEETLIQGFGRVRDVRQGPDGYIYVAIGNRGGSPSAIYRMEPAGNR